MAQKYYNSAETAKILDVSIDDVKKMMDRRELHGYRDGDRLEVQGGRHRPPGQEPQAEQPAAPETEPAEARATCSLARWPWGKGRWGRRAR